MKMMNSKLKRILSLFLSITVLLATLPVISMQAAETDPNVISDTPTVHEWKNFFSAENQNTLSTEHSGFIWSDKSVFTTEDINETNFPNLSAKLGVGTNNFGNKNFLVSLATIGSNTEIKGYSTTPTDTMLVLDLSNSMDSSGSVPSLITSANSAIKSLLELNNHNRIGVVLFSGNSDLGASNTSTATVILPLGRYKTGNDNQYLVYTGNNNNTTVSLSSNIRYENGGTVTRKSKTTDGGTYIQNGLYQAYNQYPSGEDTIIPADQLQAGTQRMPILVLMTDGAPTTATDSYNNVGTSQWGDGDDDTAEIGFMTQLTASWVKDKLKTKYNGEEPRFYTLGLGTSNNRTATGVLNPSSNQNNASGYWTDFLADGRVTLRNVEIANSVWDNDDDVTITKQDNTNLVKNYATRYWSANNSQGLISAFNSIVSEIVLQSRYYGTLVTSNVHETDGYVYFSDEIGSYMEIKNIKGIHLGEGRLCTGGMFADYFENGRFGINNTPTEYGLELINSMTSRLGITTQQLYTLLETARENDYIYYDNATGKFSNYVAWYADEDMNYIAPYNPVVALVSDEAPKYIVKSYIYLGEETLSHAASDMMYAYIRVKEDISTGRQTLDAALPAALLPMVTTTVTLDSDAAVITEENIVSVTNNIDEQHPAVLFYEVGLDSEINPYNIDTIIPEDEHDFRKNQDGTYSFYSNRWRDDNGNSPNLAVPDDYNIFNDLIYTTVVNYVPSAENEAYYYTDDTLIYKYSQGNYTLVSSTEVLDSQNDYYWAKQHIEKDAQGNIDLITTYEKISDTIINNADTLIKNSNSYKVVKKGTPRKNIRESEEKLPSNITGTLEYSEISYVNSESILGHTDYQVYFFHGNNGKLTVAPAQGIRLTKTVETTVDNAPDSFVFDIKLTGDDIENSYQYRLEKANGDIEEGTVDVGAGNIIEVTISDGDTYYINGIADGTDYKVTERYNNYYVASSDNASGTITTHTISSVDFVNTPRGKGSLLVAKDVNHPFGDNTLPAGFTDKEFDVTVTLSGQGLDMVSVSDGTTPTISGNTYTYNFAFKDGEFVLFSNIPEGTEYNVTENNIPAGFELKTTDLSGEIVNDTESEVLLVNEYTQQPVSPKVKVTGTKTIINRDWSDALDNGKYKVALQRVNVGGTGNVAVGDPIITTISKSGDNDPSYTIDMSSIEYKTVGSYTYRIYEVHPSSASEAVADIAYDNTWGLFTVVITDNDLDGKLEVSNVFAIEGTATSSGNSNDGWTITNNFKNTYQAETISFNANKKVVSADDPNTLVHEHSGGILFGLYKDVNDANPTYTALTDKDGKAAFALNVLKSEYSTTKYFYMKEIIPLLENRVVGMTYDEEFRYVVSVDWSGENVAVKFYNYEENAAYGVGSEITESDLIITNTYEENVTTTAIELSGEKTITGRTMNANDKFTFTVDRTEGDFATVIRNIQTVQNNGSAIEFDPITFSTPGTKYLLVKETVQNGDGITCDTTKYHITVVVAKAEDATTKQTILEVKSTTILKIGTGVVNSDEIDFVNRYSINDKETVVIDGTKVISGRNINEGEFTFTLTEKTDSTFATVKAGGIKLETKNSVRLVTNTNTAKFSFSEIEYTEPGVFYYTVEETIPANAQNNKLNGVTYTTEKFNVKVTVEDNGDGTLKTEVEYINGEPVFNNLYETEGTSVTLSGVKTLTGRNKAMEAGEFTFNLYKTDSDFIVDSDPIKTASNSADGSYSITLNYDDADKLVGGGVYYYVLEESVPNERKGIGYDTTEYHITVTLVDNGLGVLMAYTQVNLIRATSTPVAVDELDFNNIYSADSTLIDISGTKNYNKALADDMFTFELYEGQTKIAETKNKADGSFVFEDIELDEAKTYVFTVKETNSGQRINGITYNEDGAEYTVTVVVTDNDEGKLVAGTPVISDGTNDVTAIEFKNTYTAGKTSVDISGTKVYNKALADDMFTFELYDGQTKIAETKNKADGSFLFDNVELNEAKTYEFTVKEVNSGERINGISYNIGNAEYKVTVEVTDNGAGELVAGTPVITKGGQTVSAITFENKYTADFTSFDIIGAKQYNKTIADDMFEFALYEGNTLVSRVKNVGRSFIFDDVPLTEAKTYVFTVKEVNSGERINGISYNKNGAEYTVTVEVTDNGAGKLIAGTPVISDGTNNVSEITFVNEYTADETSVDISGKKQYNKTLSADMFSFELYDGQTKIAETKNKANGNFIFEDIALKEAKTYVFTVKEVNSGKRINGISYNKNGAEYTVTVEVTDNGAGKLIAGTPVISNGTNNVSEIIFVNEYTADKTSIDISGKKQYNKTLSADMFSFELYEGQNKIAETKNKADGSFVFEDIQLTEAKTYEFIVKEVNSGERINGIKYNVDNSVYTVSVEVTDNGQGLLIAGTPSIKNGTAPANEIVFKNEYTADKTDSAIISGDKNLIGRDIADGEFEFELYNADDTYTKQGDAIKVVTNIGNKFEFSDITFDTAGEHYFVVGEVIGNAERMEYDESLFGIHISVSDNGQGKLIATAPEYIDIETMEPVERIAFNNVYTPKPEDLIVDITVEKTVNNTGDEKIGPEGFEFILKDKDSKEELKVKTDKNGKAVLNITYSEEDIGKTFNYVLNEIDTGIENVTYSTVSYEFKVVVSLTEDNEINATISKDGKVVNKAVAAFENTYTVPEVPLKPDTPLKPDVPQTGDWSNINLWIALFFISGGGLFGSLIFGKKKKEN